ncbi:MAG: tRNA uridine 5-oxyacetic acid(34) methyltransferase CmoM [Candidatus Pelagadaptatus aseana]|uniref:methyltransferase domain-containing protein n=1 Tax=Candidatus Pelagadaptatus aseana TaxID=3120508 RepID=UPI0039B301C3
MSWPADRNFDDLAHRFKRNVYDGLKGEVRLEVLTRDLSEFMPGLYPEHLDFKPLRILDAGGGQGQFSLSLAQQGHYLTLCDISENMLALARDNACELGLEDQINFHLGSIQSLACENSAGYDLVLCHAVLEWVSDPKVLLDALVSMMSPDGILSLTFYNVNGTLLKNLLRGNFQKVLDNDFRGYRGSLTPTYPREPERVLQWLLDRHQTVLCRSGIRCFHDYILDPEVLVSEPEQQLALELALSREEPWRSLGRYIHVLSRGSE